MPNENNNQNQSQSQTQNQADPPANQQQSSQTPATQQKPPSKDAPGDQAQQQNGANDEAKYRRLFEKAEADKKTLQAERDKLAAEKKTRDDADLTEAQKVAKRAEEAEKRAAEAERKLNISKIGAELGLAPEALELISGSDEAAIRAQAEKLAKLTVRPPVSAGTTTQPGTGQAATLDQQIAEAEKAGNRYASIALKTQKMRGL